MTDAQTLISSARDYNRSAGDMALIELGLWRKIAENGIATAGPDVSLAVTGLVNGANGWVSGDLLFTATVSAGTTVVKLYKGAGDLMNTSYGPTFSFDLPVTMGANWLEGVQTFYVVATNANGSTTSNVITLKIDDSYPAIAITAPTTGATITETPVTVTATASDTGAGVANVQFSLDEDESGWHPQGSLTTTLDLGDFYPPLSDGAHVLHAQVWDDAGHTDQTPPSVNVTIANPAFPSTWKTLAYVDDAYGNVSPNAIFMMTDYNYTGVGDTSPSGNNVGLDISAGEASYTPAYRILDGGSFSVCFWFKTEATSASGEVLLSISDSGYGQNIKVTMDDINTMVAYGDSGYIFGTALYETFNDGYWHFICIRVTPSAIDISFDNGTPQTGLAYALSGLLHFEIGGFTNSSSHFSGQLWGIGVFAKAISDSQVTYLYNSGAGRDWDGSTLNT
jgi:hypothetical protein